MATKCTVWDVLKAAAKYDGSPTAHKDVVKKLQAKGHHVSMSDEWCTETVMAILYDAGGIDLVGGFTQTSGTLRKRAEKLGIWKEGTGDILPGDIVLFGKPEKTNHTELSLGANVNVSGNYKEISKDTCARRKRSGRRVVGRIRPKYAEMPEMDNLQYTVAAVDCMLGVYGSGSTREKQLSVFGQENAALIQAEINRVWGKEELVIRDMAIYAIAGFAGKNDYRKTRLGKYADKTQAEINAIAEMAGKTISQAADDVWSDRYGKNAVRRLLLAFNGYDPDKVQAEVNKLKNKLGTPEEKADTEYSKVRLYVPRFFENDPDKYFGDEAIFLQYDKAGNIVHSVMFDTGMSGSLAVKKLKALPLNGRIDAIVLSHDHGDHTGNVKAIMDSFEVGHLYMPEQSGVRKYRKSYAERMDSYEKHAKKKGVPVTYLKKGDSFTVGVISCKAIFLANADKLPEKDSHHFINNMSLVVRITVDGTWRVLIGGDLSADGIRQMMAAGVDFACDVFKFFWHSDRGAILKEFAKKLKGVFIGYTQYRHAERKGNGRKSTHDLLRNVGAVVVRSCEDGEIYMDMAGKVLTLTTSKGIKKTYKKG